MINVRRIFAIFKKQLKDTLKNKAILLQFILFPLMSFILTKTIVIGTEELSTTYFVVLFAAMYTGMVPNVNMASIMAEEKESNTLRVLMMANVKPMEYLIGVGSYILIMCAVGGLSFGLIGGYTGGELFKFVLVMIIGILTSLILGGAIGMLAKNQMNATSIVLPIAMVAAFLPMLSNFNITIRAFSKFLYTQQVYYLVNDLSKANYTFGRFAIIMCNVAIFTGVFFIAYKKGNIAE